MVFGGRFNHRKNLAIVQNGRPPIEPDAPDCKGPGDWQNDQTDLFEDPCDKQKREGIEQALGAGGKKLVLLCRSGVRSIAAAQRATELGLQAYNILEGFEGDPDANAHRGLTGGWRYHGLPWQQN